MQQPQQVRIHPTTYHPATTHTFKPIVSAADQHPSIDMNGDQSTCMTSVVMTPDGKCAKHPHVILRGNDDGQPFLIGSCPECDSEFQTFQVMLQKRQADLDRRIQTLDEHVTHNDTFMMATEPVRMPDRKCAKHPRVTLRGNDPVDGKFFTLESCPLCEIEFLDSKKGSNDSRLAWIRKRFPCNYMSNGTSVHCITLRHIIMVPML